MYFPKKLCVATSDGKPISGVINKELMGKKPINIERLIIKKFLYHFSKNLIHINYFNLCLQHTHITFEILAIIISIIQRRNQGTEN